MLQVPKGKVPHDEHPRSFTSPGGQETMKKAAEYRQAYLIGRQEHLPTDFPLAVDFEQVAIGMFVPARAYGRLRGLRSPACIVLLSQTMLLVIVHPREGGTRKIVPLHEILASSLARSFQKEGSQSARQIPYTNGPMTCTQKDT